MKTLLLLAALNFALAIAFAPELFALFNAMAGGFLVGMAIEARKWEDRQA